MKLAKVTSHGVPIVGAVVGEEVVDLTAALGADMDDLSKLLSLGCEAEDLVQRCIRTAASRLPLRGVTLVAPILRPDKILGVGMNYHSFVAAVKRCGIPIPTERLWFYRPRGCIVGPSDHVWLPSGASDFDYEAELAVVIGRRCRRVSPADAPAAIGAFTVANDMTLRERLLKSVVFGKSFDTHMPLGPWLVTPDEVGDPHNLAVSTWVNGELRQRSNTDDMIASCYELISEISAACTLNAGDIILTGTPEGCGMFARPARTLAKNDVVRVEIEKIGSIENRVVDEPGDMGLL